MSTAKEKKNGDNWFLPQNAIIDAVHWASGWAIEFAGEILVVGERANNAEPARTVRIRQDLVFETFGRFNSAPQIGVG